MSYRKTGSAGKGKAVDFTSPGSLASQALKIVTAPQRAVDRAVWSPVRELFQAMDPNRFGGTASLSEAFGLSGNEKSGLGAIFDAADASGKPLFGGNKAARIVIDLANSLATDPISGAAHLGTGAVALKAVVAGADAEKVASAAETTGTLRKLLESLKVGAGETYHAGTESAFRARELLGATPLGATATAETAIRSGARLSPEVKQALGYTSRLTWGHGDAVFTIPGTERVGDLISRVGGIPGEAWRTRTGLRNAQNAALIAGEKAAPEIGRIKPFLRGQALSALGEIPGEAAKPGAMLQAIAGVAGKRAADGLKSRFAMAGLDTLESNLENAGKEFKRLPLARTAHGGAEVLGAMSEAGFVVDTAHPLGFAVQSAKQRVLDELANVGVNPQLIEDFSTTWDNGVSKWAGDILGGKNTAAGGGRDIRALVSDLSSRGGEIAGRYAQGQHLEAEALASGMFRSYMTDNPADRAVKDEFAALKETKDALPDTGVTERALKNATKVKNRDLRIALDDRARIMNIVDDLASGAPLTPRHVEELAVVTGGDVPKAAEMLAPLDGPSTTQFKELIKRTAQQAADTEAAVKAARAGQQAEEATLPALREVVQAKARALDSVPVIDDAYKATVKAVKGQYDTTLKEATSAGKQWEGALPKASEVLANAEISPSARNVKYGELTAAEKEAKRLTSISRELEKAQAAFRKSTPLTAQQAGQDVVNVLSRAGGDHVTRFAEALTPRLNEDLHVVAKSLNYKEIFAPFREEVRAAQALPKTLKAAVETATASQSEILGRLGAIHPGFPPLITETAQRLGRDLTPSEMGDVLGQYGETLKTQADRIGAEKAWKLSQYERVMRGAPAATKKLTAEHTAAIKAFTEGQGRVLAKDADVISLAVQQRDLERVTRDYLAGLAEREMVVNTGPLNKVRNFADQTAADAWTAARGERDVALQAHQGALDAVKAHEISTKEALQKYGIDHLVGPDADAKFFQTYIQQERAGLHNFGDIFMGDPALLGLFDPKVDPQQFSKVTQLWKAYAILRPGFSNRNFIGAWVNNKAYGVTLKHYRQSAEIIDILKRGALDELPAWATKARVGDAYERLVKSGQLQDLTKGASIFSHGGLAAAQLGETFDRGSFAKMVALTGPGRGRVGFGVATLTGVEDNVRLAQFLRLSETGVGFDRAIETVYATHFDYSDLSNFDKAVRKWVPFWTYRSRALPLQAQLFMSHPELSRSMWLTRERNKADGSSGNLPNWLSGLAMPWGGTVLDLNNYLPGSDVIALADHVSRLRSDIPGESAAVVSSFAGGPGFNLLELMFNKQLGLGGRPIMDSRSPAPQQVGQLAKYLGTRIGTVNDLGVTLPRILANLAPGGAPAGNAATSGVSWLGLFPKITTPKP